MEDAITINGLAQVLANIACAEDLTQSDSGSQYNSDL